MIISAHVLLLIGSVVGIPPPALAAARARKTHASCPPFPHVALQNGKITAIGTQKYLFRCDPGYFLASPPQVRCWKGKWSSVKEPTCLKAEGQCEDPEPVEGGEVLGGERHEGSVVQYMCKPGFVLMGEGTRTCLRNGHWSGITPVCMDESEPLQNVAERFKEKFVTDMGSHSSDRASDQTDTEDEFDLSPVSVVFPPDDPRFKRKQQRRYESKKGKLAFKPSLSTIQENVEGEELSGSGHERVLLYHNRPCYKNPSTKQASTYRELKISFGDRKMSPKGTLIKEIIPVNRLRGRKHNRKSVKYATQRKITQHRSNTRGGGSNRRRKYVVQ